MIASGFKPVGWVAGVGVAALGCYMLSLQVAAERAGLVGLDRRIVSTRQQIRSLQTELGTRGRIQQLEAWNDQVLALSAPVSGQFVEGQVSLARFDTRQPPQMADTATVRMASADSQVTAVPDARAIVPQPQRAVATASAVAPPSQTATVQRTSLVMPATSPAATTVQNRPTGTPGRSPAATATAGRSAPTATTAERTRLADAGTSQSAARKTPTTAPARTTNSPARAVTAPIRTTTPTRTAATTTTPLRTSATTTRAATPSARTAATTSTPRPSLLNDRAVRDLRVRAERERGTGN